jgi:hypothetical protein
LRLGLLTFIWNQCLLFWTKTQKKNLKPYTRAKKRQSLLIFSFIHVLVCIKKTNLEVGLGCYCWYWSVEVITEAFCTYTANFWMLYYWIVLATHRKEVSDVLIRPWIDSDWAYKFRPWIDHGGFDIGVWIT